MSRTIQSPGVEINEIDLSLRPDLPIGTNILIPGFSPAGPVDEVLQVASLSQFEQMYGLPTNAAERYFYHTVKAAFQSPGNIYVSRLPYGKGRGNHVDDTHYSATLYPVKTTLTGSSSAIPLSGLYDLMSDPEKSDEQVNLEIGAPTYVELNEEEYQYIIDGKIEWAGNDTGEIAETGNPTVLDKVASAGIVILNDRSLTINEKFEGYYVGLVDNQEFGPGSAYKGITNIKTINSASKSVSQADQFRTVSSSRLAFPLESSSETQLSYREGSVSEVFENMPSSDISTTEFSDILVLGVFKLRKSTLDPDTEKLSYALSEYHIGSLNAHREQFDPNGGAPVSYSLQDVSTNSAQFKLLVNKHIAESGDWLNRNADLGDVYNDTMSEATSGELVDPNDGGAVSRVNVKMLDGAKNLYAHGVYKQVSEIKSTVGNIPTKLDRVFELIDNHELFPLDVTCEAGLGTIFAATYGGRTEANYDDEAFYNLNQGIGPDTLKDDPDYDIDSWNASTGPADCWNYNAFYPQLDDQGNPVASDSDEYDPQNKGGIFSPGQKQFLGGPVMWYRNVANSFVNFAALKRKDHMCVLDPLRHIFVQGINGTVLSDKSKNFSQHVYWPLRHIYQSINTSYGAVYGNWAKTFDGKMSRNVWVPMSGYLAAMYANTDANFQPWFAPAGFTRGVLNGIADIAIYPKQKHRDQLYKINVNPVANFPNDGFTVFGQKTLQSKPSAFDRINVRRLFLYLEKATRATAKYFVFEPNTLFTRTQVVNVLTPIFDRAKNTQGMYDFLLICDERNNTPDVIDQNEMVIDIYIKPVRAAEFILVNFYATRTGQDFSELVS